MQLRCALEVDDEQRDAMENPVDVRTDYLLPDTPFNGVGDQGHLDEASGLDSDTEYDQLNVGTSKTSNADWPLETQLLSDYIVEHSITSRQVCTMTLMGLGSASATLIRHLL
jgi:hypothetical protein